MRRQASRIGKGGILVLNAGSSSLKFALYQAGPAESLRLSSRGEIERIGAEPHFVVTDASGKVLAEQNWEAEKSVGVHDLLQVLMGWIESHFGAGHLVAAGHRVALGGLEHSGPMLLTDAVIDRLRRLVPLAPLHQPHNLDPIEALWKFHPAMPQVACFDTAFHRTMPPVAELYGLPRSLTEAGARRYGFHGLSYEYIAGELPMIDAEAAVGRTVVAHLGSGASMCALAGGRSVATTMGFSPLSGLVMGTRPGELDPGVLFWLMREKNLSWDEIESKLYCDSGLLGVSGISGDMRVLLASTDQHAREAVDLFVYRICRELGSLAAALNGLDALVFTGGIGEHAAPIRAAVCRQCAWLGIAIDETANQRGGPMLNTTNSQVKVWVVPTDEELMIARHTAAIVLADVAAMSS
jgi:acetate kinase